MKAYVELDSEEARAMKFEYYKAKLINELFKAFYIPEICEFLNKKLSR